MLLALSVCVWGWNGPSGPVFVNKVIEWSWVQTVGKAVLYELTVISKLLAVNIRSEKCSFSSTFKSKESVGSEIILKDESVLCVPDLTLLSTCPSKC